MKYLFIFFTFLSSLTLFAQQQTGGFVKDKKTGCRIWNENISPEDSISWAGGCKNKMADGFGTLSWYDEGQMVAQYIGMMQKGIPNGPGKYNYDNGHTAEGNFVNGELNGYGKYVIGPGRQLEGNFANGKFLNLDTSHLKKLQRRVIPIQDSTNIYVGDGYSNELFYYALVPLGMIKGTLVLLPGTWESPENVLSSNRQLVELAWKKNIAVIVPSLNQRLTLNQVVLDFLNGVFKDATDHYKLPKDKFVMGGFSMGGLMSVRYTEMALEDSSKTVIVPKAVYSVDGPADLESLYRNFQIKAEGSPPYSEARYGLMEFDRYLGGPPDSFHLQYVYYSIYSHREKNGGNARFLEHTPIRIYTDVDPNWWITNRKVDMYDLNALDQSAMILHLNKLGNRKAEFINAFGKGYRIEGNRHPHSWSIVDAEDCIKWIQDCLE